MIQHPSGHYFSHRDLCYGYSIADIHMTRDILLLLFLVLTCHLSVLTFFDQVLHDTLVIRPCRNMTCIWNRNLHGQRVDRINKHHQKQFKSGLLDTKAPNPGKAMNTHGLL